jgi:hypothetical protein
MRCNTSHRDLDQRIEQLVREHIATMQRSARQALERAFSCPAVATGAPRRPAREEAETSVEPGGKRRGPAEMSAVAERLYRVVCAHPGESMAALAAELAAAPSELQRPMALLRQARRVRSVGHAT